MAASVLLYAVGEQDLYLSGKPSMTYFQTVYIRHTPFLVETYEIPWDNPIAYGKSSIATIPPKGDIITGVTLKTTHAPLAVTNASSFFCWPTWPTDITTQPTVYTLQAGVFVPTIQTVPGSMYYSTYNVGIWAYNYYPSVVTLTANTSSNTFSFTGTTTVYFLDTFSAVFFGMDPRNPDSRTRNAYGYNVTTQRNAQLAFIQSGWVPGVTPPQNVSYFDGLGTRVVDRASLLLGGQTISETTGRYIDLRNDMDVSLNNQSGLTVLVGKNDTSPQYINRICYTRLNFGVDHIPVCALGLQDTQVTVDFAPFSNLYSRTAASDGSLFSPSAYTTVDMRTQFGVAPWNTYKLIMYRDTMAFDEKNTNKRYFFNMQQSISNVAAFTGPLTPSGATYPVQGETTYANGVNGRVIGSNIYSVVTSGAGGFATSLPVNDYFVTNVNSTVTSTVPIWANGAYGPIQNSTNQGDGSVAWPSWDARSASGKYLYYYAQINYVYLPTSGVSTAWYSGSVGSGNFSLTHTFFGTTNPTQASVDEWVLYVKARDPAITSNTSNTNTVSGSNCRVQMTFTTPTTFTTIKIAQWFGDNRVVIRYDTTMGINDPTAYSYYRDFNSLFNYIFTTAYSSGWGDPSTQESLQLQGDGRYLYQRIGNYIITIDTTLFGLSNGYSVYNWTSLSPTPNIFVRTPIIFDNLYGYTNSPGSSGIGSANNNMCRFRIGADLSLNSSWEIFSTLTAFPWLTINNNNDVTGAARDLGVSAFDGRYVYYVGGSTSRPSVFRYDTQRPFQASSFTWIAKHWSIKILKTDPTLYATINDRKPNDYRNWVTVDSFGNIFMAAYVLEKTHVIKNFDGTTFTTLTNINLSFGGSYIVKYNSAGIGQWVVYYDRVFIQGAGPTGITKLVTDSVGNLYVSISGLIGGPDATLYNANGTQYTQTFVTAGFSFGEGCVFKVNSAGAIQWFVFTETWNADGSRATGETGISDISVDSSGNVYFSGTINGPGGQGNGSASYMNLHSTNTVSTFKQFYTAGTLSDGFIAKCNSSGILQWASNVSSTNANDFGECVKLTSAGEVFFTGRFSGTPLSIYNAAGTLYGTLTRSGTSDIFMIKYDATTGAVTAASSITNGRAIGPSSCATDSLGNAYVGVSGDSNVYVYKINTSTLATTWISRTTAKGNMIVGVDSSDAPYMTCYFDSNTVSVYDSSASLYTTYNNTTNPYPLQSYSDTLIVKYTTAGVPSWSQVIQGRADEFPVGLNIDATGNTWVYAAYLSPTLYKFYGDNNPFADTQFPSIGQVNGASSLILLRYSSSNGSYLANSGKNTLGGDDRFVTSNGNDLVGVDPALQGSWVLTIGPKYIYLYTSDPYNNGQTQPSFIQFDPTTFNPALTSSLLIDYATLSSAEMKWFQDKTQDYVIERLQKSSFPISAQESYKTLTFDSPVKEFFVTLMSPANQNTYTYSNLTSMALTLNGETLVDQDSTLFQFVEPFETKLSFPTRNVSTYAFCSPVNFSRIRDKQLRINVPSGTTGTLDVYARTLNVLRYRNGMAGLIFNSRAGVE